MCIGHTAHSNQLQYHASTAIKANENQREDNMIGQRTSSLGKVVYVREDAI